MKYWKIAEDRHFYDFVFYETENDKMFIYCPNCASVHEVNMKQVVPRYEKQKVAWMKKNYSPCTCFDMRSVPKYCRSDREYSRLGTEIDIGEFCKNADGSVSVNVFRQTTNFAASNYECGRPFKRNPIFNLERTIDFTFREGEKTKIETCLFRPMCSSRISVGYGWSSVKNWRSTLVFNLIEQSLDELKGTYLEKYIPEIYKFQEALSDFINIDEVPMGDYTVQFLKLLCENAAFRKVWKAGYKTLAINKVFESIMIGGNSGYYTPTYYLCGTYIDKKFTNAVVNWRGKSIVRILKINPQKLDNIIDRNELTLKELKAVVELEKLGIEYNEMNIQIAGAPSFDKLEGLFEKEKLSFSKLFKYIRHAKNQSKQKSITFSNVVTDYVDYLDALIRMETPLTADVLFPTNLKISHDRAVNQYKQLEDAKKNELFEKAVKKFKKLAYENDAYKIFVVDNIRLLRCEAQNLHNCSAGYVDRIIDKNSVIFLIRQKADPDAPFYMLELNPNSLSIVQNRGLHNYGATPEVQAFANMWLNGVVRPMAKKLAKAA